MVYLDRFGGYCGGDSIILDGGSPARFRILGPVISLLGNLR